MEKNSSNTKKWMWIAIVIIVLIVILCVQQHYKNVANGGNSGANSNATVGMQYSLDGNTFTLAGTSTIIMSEMGMPANMPMATGTVGTMPPMPVSYSFAASSTGTVDAGGTPGQVVALYHGYGANIIVPAVFVFAQNPAGANAGPMVQIAATSTDTAYEDAQIQSVSVAQGIVTLNLLVVSAKDMQNLPHYEWKPNQAVSVRYTITKGTLVPVAGK